MTTFTPFDQATCKKKITRIGRVGKALQQEIHLVACSALAHVRDYGDYTIMTSLLDALPNGQRVKSLAHWVSHFSNGQLTYSFDKNVGWLAKLAKNRDAEGFNVDAAYATSYADLTTEKDPKTMTVKQVLAYLKRKAEDDGTFTNTDVPKVDEKARELFASLYAFACDKV